MIRIAIESLRKIPLVRLLLLVSLAVVLFGYTLPWIVENSGGREYSGIDFHGYWYAGQFTRAGVNPYWAILNKENYPVYWDPRIPGSGGPSSAGNESGGVESELELPIRYIDGQVAAEHPIAKVLIVVPAATAPLTLFMGLLSWLSWPLARTAWLGLNLILALMIPWLGFRLLQDHKDIEFSTKLLCALAFYNFYGLRQAMVVGQQSIIALFLLLLALLVRDRWVLAGILLGIGLSKYSVGLPIFVFFLLQKRVRIVVVSLIVQLVGAVLLVSLEHGSLFETAKAYLKMLSLNYSQEGVHLPARMPEMRSAEYIIPIIFLVALMYLLRYGYFKFAIRYAGDNAMQLNTLNLLTIGLFLPVYHRIHDLPFMIFFLLSIMAVYAGSFEVSPKAKAHVVFAALFLICGLIAPTIPGKIILCLGISVQMVSTFASANAVSTYALLLMFGLSAWIQLRLFTHPKVASSLGSRLS